MIITLKKIRVRPVIGVFQWEKECRQDLLITAKIEYDGSKAAKSDNIDDTVNYFALAEEIVEKVEASQFELVEKLVDFILEIIMSRDIVTRAEVEIDKLAPLRRIAECVSVTGVAER